MNPFGKLMNMMRVNPDVDDEYEDDYEDDYDEELDAPVRPAVRRSAPAAEVAEPEERKSFFPTRKVTPVRKPGGMEVALLKPTAFDDARELADYLLDGKAVVLNMEGIQTETAQRIIDFTCGATYSLNGKLQKISNYIFIVTPSSISLSGEFQGLVNEAGEFDISGLNIHV